MEWWGNSHAFGRLWTLGDSAPDIWLDASDSASMIIQNGFVSDWRDKSGNSRHIAQSITAARPVLTVAGQNGKNVITFDGVDDMLYRATAGAAGATSVTIIAVLKMLGGGSTEDVIMGVGSTGSTAKVRGMYRAASGTTLGFAGWAADVTSSTHSLDINGSFHVFGAWNTQLTVPNNVRLMRDGTVTTHTTTVSGTNTALQAAVDGFSVGSLQGGAAASYHANFSVAEIGVWYRTLSDTQRQQVEGSLAHSWATTAFLPAGHPYKFSPPMV